MIKKFPFLSLLFCAFFVNAQQSYYDDVDLTKTGLDLKDELATKITTTHTQFLSYTPGVWDACKATDVNPDNDTEVLLLYGRPDGTATLSRTRGIDDNGGNFLDWNREHVYPKSLGNPNLGETGPGADAHHLRACDVSRNSSRSNQLFADGSGNSDNVTGGWYPGDEWKGDVARMMMYMYLRYGDQCLPSAVGVGTANAIDSNMIDLFLEWNAEDPVSQIEDNRNEYHEDTSNNAAQGNRNPFIDNPYLATLIWGGTAAENRWSATASSNSFESFEAKIYPNPSANGTINIQLSNQTNITNINIISVIGKSIFNVQNPDFENNKFTINNLASGVYLIKLTSKTGTTTKKLIVK